MKMREFFGLIMLIVLLSIWSFVFAEAKVDLSNISPNPGIVVEQKLNN